MDDPAHGLARDSDPHRIDSIEALERLHDAPLETSPRKELPALNAHYRRLVAASPFLAIASVGPAGLDCSPRGDARGFVHVLDAATLAFPDRRGNNRLDTLRNIVVDPRVALLFVIPGREETLRVNGRARVTVAPALLERFAVDGRVPVAAVTVGIDAVYFQCARVLERSGLWDPGSWADVSDLPSAGTLIRSAVRGFDAAGYDATLQERQARTLW